MYIFHLSVKDEDRSENARKRDVLNKISRRESIEKVQENGCSQRKQVITQDCNNSFKSCLQNLKYITIYVLFLR